MASSRFLGPVDIGIIVVLIVFVVLPPRHQYASPVLTDEFSIALAEARTIASPGDGAAIDELTHKLGEAQQKDWAIDFSVLASERAKESPTRWRALLAASTAFVDRFDVQPGLDYANRAVRACELAQARRPSDCSEPDHIRAQLYQQALEAGVKSGFDPRTDREKFLKSETGSMLIHLGRRDAEP